MDINIWDDETARHDHWTGDPVEALAYFDRARRETPNLVLHITRYETYEGPDGYIHTNTNDWIRLTRAALTRLAAATS